MGRHRLSEKLADKVQVGADSVQGGPRGRPRPGWYRSQAWPLVGRRAKVRCECGDEQPAAGRCGPRDPRDGMVERQQPAKRKHHADGGPIPGVPLIELVEFGKRQGRPFFEQHRLAGSTSRPAEGHSVLGRNSEDKQFDVRSFEELAPLPCRFRPRSRHADEIAFGMCAEEFTAPQDVPRSAGTEPVTYNSRKNWHDSLSRDWLLTVQTEIATLCQTVAPNAGDRTLSTARGPAVRSQVSSAPRASRRTTRESTAPRQ